MPIDICLGRFNASWFSWCMRMPAYSIRTHRAKYGGEESLRSINRSERLPATREGRSRDVRYLIVGEYFSRWTEFWGIVRLVEDQGGLMTQLFNVCALLFWHQAVMKGHHACPTESISAAIAPVTMQPRNAFPSLQPHREWHRQAGLR